MSVRVNLLKDNEIRHYRAVSRSFALRTGGIGLALLLILLVLMFGFRVMSVRSGLEECRAEWAELEPRFEKYQSLKNNLKVNEGLINELNQWKQLKQGLEGSLFRLQALAPESLQFTSMNLNGSLGARIDRTQVGKGDETQEIVTVIPSRTFQLVLKGTAEGDLADAAVVQFVKTLRSDPDMSELWESVKLQNMVKKKGASESTRVFTLEALSRTVESQ